MPAIVTIGCDPEFVLVDPVMDMPVSGFMLMTRSATRSNSKFGLDGSLVSYELRPSPSDDTITLMSNIRYILRRFIKTNKFLTKYLFIGGNAYRGVPLGGHIHIRFPESYVDKYIVLCSELVDHLDTVLFYGLRRIVDDKEGRRTREGCGYGFPTSYRVKTVYDSDTNMSYYNIEYRSPPSWLPNIELSFLYLTLAKLVALTILSYDYPVLRNYLCDIRPRQEDNDDFAYSVLDNICRMSQLYKYSLPKDVLLCLNVLKKVLRKGLDVMWRQDFKAVWGIGG